ncbi:MAG: dihydroorotate dehydrogenase electron transfer subunit [Candidatus Omnitrophica bacterium]|nr:dihydroorotate dehydrogenase electron transfer subunit [Candidatus Omnitrophota bacterium]MBU1925365.1 dihydroorotate dehydrogenase electron transfer subunit [Candidatus Omnitrophota bacterium]
MLYQKQAFIVENKQIAPAVYKLKADIPGLAGHLKAGQFLHLRIGESYDPLLRRPFSVYKIENQKGNGRKLICIIYKVIGRGTKILSQKTKGELLNVLGPLGNGFDFIGTGLKNRPVFLVAGGMGVAPLFFLASMMIKKTKPDFKKNVIIFIGSPNRQELVLTKEFDELGFKIQLSTDDGSRGFKGYVCELLENYLKKKKVFPLRPYVYACGPNNMLKALDALAGKYRLDGQISVDKMMGCGVGACLGCVVKVKDNCNGQEAKYKRICKDGPVFKINEIIWED